MEADSTNESAEPLPANPVPLPDDCTQPACGMSAHAVIATGRTALRSPGPGYPDTPQATRAACNLLGHSTIRPNWVVAQRRSIHDVEPVFRGQVHSHPDPEHVDCQYDAALLSILAKQSYCTL